MKIVFTNPPWFKDGQHGIRAGCRWPWVWDTPKPPEETTGYYNTYPFFLSYAASYVFSKSAGKYTVFLYDALALAHTYEKFYQAIDEIKPDIVVIETSTPSINNDLEIAKKLSENGVEIALSGPHATVFAEELIKLPYISYILKGEYEVSSYEMCLMRRKGIYESRPVQNLDMLPYPMRDKSIYLYQDMFNFQFQHPQLQLWTSRGCPYRCNFCLWNHTMTNHNYRIRSVRSVMRELTACMRAFQFRSVLFDDDTFNVGDKRVLEFCDVLQNIDIEWQAMVRIDGCSKNAFSMMRWAGCTGLKIGVESFSQRELDFMNKDENAGGAIETIDFLVDLGFKIYLSLTNNVPGSTDEDESINNKWLKYFADKGVKYQYPNLMPLPGTELYKNSKPLEKWEDYGKFK